MTRFGEPVPYDATAVRPSYTSLPEAVRKRIAAELGGEPVAETVAGGGFTGGFAARLTAASGVELFAKAAGPELPFVIDAYRREASVNAALPKGVPAPEMVAAEAVGDWMVLVFAAVDGYAPTLPMRSIEVDLLLRAWAEASEALAPVPEALREAGAGQMDCGFLLNFSPVASGEAEPFPVPERLEGRVEELAELESGLAAALEADAVGHGDLRPDNMILSANRAWICDWNHAELYAPWFDTVALLVAAHGDGHDAERLFWSHPTAREVADEQLDAVLTAMASYYLSRAAMEPYPEASPFMRRHQRWSGLAAADWLATRRGW
jgi:aminoglycoside phosphotransferase (APT) family kinase protein